MPLPLPKPLTGIDPLSRWLMHLRQVLQASMPRDSEDILISETTQGTQFRLKSKAGGGGTFLRRLRLKEVGNDYLRCRSLDGTTEGTTDLYVARSFELRRTPFDAQTIAYSADGDVFSATFAYTSATKRTKTISGVAEVQVIVPYYKVDFSEIMAIKSNEATGLLDPAGAPIVLMELTQRAWAKLG